MSDTAQFDKKRAKAFQANILGIINGGAVALMISLSHSRGSGSNGAGSELPPCAGHVV